MDKKQQRRLNWHRWVWNHIDGLIRLLVRLRYGPVDCEPAPPLTGGYIVLPNHVCGADQFLVAFSFLKRHMYFLVSEHTFRKKLVGHIMQWLAGPISRVKGSVDASAVMAVLRNLKRGVPVCIFPEGDRSWDGRTAPLHPSTAKLLKVSGVPIVTYRLEGGYLADPRWCRSLRHGPIHGAVVNVYPPEQIRKLSVQEIDALVFHDLYLDACEDQKKNPKPYPGKKLAEGLEEALFLCPKCGRVGTLRGKGDVFACPCGLEARYNVYGLLEGAPFDTVAAWSDWQQDQLARWTGREGELFGDEGAVIRRLNKRHRMRPVARGRVWLDRQGLHLGGMDFPAARMTGVALCHFSGCESLMFSFDGGSYELIFHNRASRRKYYIMLLALTQEVGRVNE